MDLEKELDKGIELSESGKDKEAIDVFDRIIKSDPKNVEALLNKGIALNDIGDYENALNCLDKVLKLDPENSDALNIKGFSLIHIGENTKAIGILDEALKLYPEHFYALINKGSAYSNLKKYKEAVNNFNKALDIDKDNILALFYKGESLYELNKFKDALSCFDEILSLEPEDVDSLNYKGILLVQLGDIKEGIKFYEKAIKIDPEFISPWFNIALAFRELEMHEKALKSIEGAIQIDPEYAEAWFEKGNILKDMGKKKEAIKAYEKFVELNPPHMKLDTRRVKKYIKRFKRGNVDVSFSPPKKPSYWQWITKADYFLELNDKEREALDPKKERDPGGWWTCHKDTRIGDLILLYRAGEKNGKTYQDIKYLIQAKSDAYSLTDDDYAVEHGWQYGCDYLPIYKFENSFSLKEIRKDPYLDDWNAYKGNFNRSVYKTERRHWERLMEVLIGKNPDFKNFLNSFKPEKIFEIVSTEKQFEDKLMNKMEILKPFGYNLKFKNRQLRCGNGSRMDLICDDMDSGGFVVIELKIVSATRNTFGQISEYMGWVINNMAKSKPVKGIVISKGYDVGFKEAMSSNDKIHHIELDDIIDDLGIKLKK